MIYRGKDRVLLDFGRSEFPATVTENEMVSLQRKYFEFVGTNLTVGEHEQTNASLHLIRHINKAEFEKMGRFRLIDEREYGEEYRYFIPQGEGDMRFEELHKLVTAAREKGFAQAGKRRIETERKVRAMSGDIVQFRVPTGKSAPQFVAEEILGIRKLADEEDYSSESGIRLETGGCII